MTPSDDASTPHDEAANKPWGGRFETPTNAFVEAFTASVEFDRRLYAHDIQGSIAHATMLAATGVLTATSKARSRPRSARSAKNCTPRGPATTKWQPIFGFIYATKSTFSHTR